jgi:hypothetical protein
LGNELFTWIFPHNSFPRTNSSLGRFPYSRYYP